MKVPLFRKGGISGSEDLKPILITVRSSNLVYRSLESNLCGNLSIVTPKTASNQTKLNYWLSAEQPCFFLQCALLAIFLRLHDFRFFVSRLVGTKQSRLVNCSRLSNVKICLKFKLIFSFWNIVMIERVRMKNTYSFT